jgi:deazaflavin-dependent oxidoreductase (nitroreductase family)
MRQEPGLIWRIMQRLNRRVARNYQSGLGPASVVMLLTTTGRKSGLPRITPLQYEEYGGIYYLGSARGAAADWFRNIQANSRVQVQIRQHQFAGSAEAVTEARRVADFLELRMKRHPWMIGLLMRLEGLPFRYTRQDLEHFAAKKTMVLIIPDPMAADIDHYEIGVPATGG